MYPAPRPLWTKYLLIVLTVVCATLLSAVPGIVRAHAVSVPTARQQLDWVVSATNRLPVSEAELRQHVSATTIEGVGGPAKLDEALVAQRDSRLVYRTQTSATEARAVTRAGDGSEHLAAVTVDADGLIDYLLFSPRPPAPTSWTAVDRQLRALAPSVSFTASRVGTDGSCRRVHGLDPTRQQPLGSAFKLYVLGALAQAVSRGTASWNEMLAIRDDWKSLPSGVLQNEPAGTKLTLAQYADYMISISDNTAADHLIHRLGRGAVQQQLVRFGNADPARTIPFLTTRELFVLKGYRYPTLAKAYVHAPRVLKAALQKATAAVPSEKIQTWQQPRDIDGIEWFASADDECRVLAGLQQQARRPGMGPLAQALSINDGGLALDPRSTPTVWFKGGSEPGVVTLNYLVRDARGATTVVSALFADRAHPLDEGVVVSKAQAIIRGALALAR